MHMSHLHLRYRINHVRDMGSWEADTVLTSELPYLPCSYTRDTFEEAMYGIGTQPDSKLCFGMQIRAFRERNIGRGITRWLGWKTYISPAGVRMMFGTGLDVIHSYVLDAVTARRLARRWS